MKSSSKHQMISLWLCGAVTLLCASCQSGPSKPAAQAGISPYIDKCKQDLSIPGSTCTLSKILGERIVWINNDPAQDVYVCFYSNADPFEAYAWLVPHGGGQRSSGSIDSGVHPTSAGLSYDYSVSNTPCTVSPPPLQHPQTNPKIIIKN